MSSPRRDSHLVETPVGAARITWNDVVGKCRAVLFLGHGAGGGIDAPDLVRTAEVCGAAGVRVALVEQPYRVAGKAIGSDRVKLDAAFRGVIEKERPRGKSLFVGGRSAGARIACRTAPAVGALGVAALAFPIHPPGKPEQSRLVDLEAALCPVLIIQGTRDAFGGPEKFPQGARMQVVPGADHSFNVLKSSGISQAETIDQVACGVRDFVLDLL